ncbi:MAG: DnaJ domain-containing protein [Polyangiaceae bacterium]|nr:DnaJ domain-containing protein [Polyangiaceae bacterium]
MLVSLLDRRLTGSLVIQDPTNRKSAITIAEGLVVKARTAEAVVRLGDLLVELHALDTTTLERALRLGKQANVPLGQSLLRLEAVGGPILDAALSEQLARRVVWVSGLPLETRYGFYSGTDFLGNWGAGPVESDPLALIWRTARDHASPSRVESVISRMESRRARLHPEARIDRFHFGWDETTIIERLQKEPLVVRDLLATPGGDARVLARMVYVLALTRHLDLGDGKAPLGVAPGQSSDRLARAKSGLALSSHSSGVPSITPSMLAPAPSSRPAGNGMGSRGLAVSLPPIAPSIPSPTVIEGAPASEAIPVSPVPIQARIPPPPRPASGEAGRTPAPPPTRVPSPLPSSRGTSAPVLSRAPEAPATASLRPGGMRPDPLEWRLNAKLAQCERRDFYGLLEIDKTAPTALIQAAYVKLAKVWHPDKLPPSMTHRRNDATRLFAKLSEARRLFCDAEERARFDYEQTSGESEEATVTRVVEAANEFRRAELFSRRNDFGAAITHAEAAYKGDDEQPEYAALFAYVVVQSGTPLEPKRLEELVQLVEKAVERDGENVRIRLYRAFVLKRAGRMEDAQRDFRFVARHDRHNVDAMREIRLYNIRKDKEKTGSILGSLFGRPSTTPKSRR